MRGGGWLVAGWVGGWGGWGAAAATVGIVCFGFAFELAHQANSQDNMTVWAPLFKYLWPSSHGEGQGSPLGAPTSVSRGNAFGARGSGGELDWTQALFSLVAPLATAMLVIIYVGGWSFSNGKFHQHKKKVR
jgi:hypothetical protein